MMRNPLPHFGWQDWLCAAICVIVVMGAFVGAYLDVTHAIETGVIG